MRRSIGGCTGTLAHLPNTPTRHVRSTLARMFVNRRLALLPLGFIVIGQLVIEFFGGFTPGSLFLEAYNP